jgi:glyoxylase-like metal-dependent hydrolase (beta-lactamase superfamily II)
MLRSAIGLVIMLLSCSSAYSQRGQTSMREIIPGHYMFSSGDLNSGIIVTDEGVVVVDALDSEAVARAEREAIANTIRKPVRILVSSPYHNPFSKGNVAYADVWKIGHENYRSDLVRQLERDKASPEEQKARLPHQTFRDRMTLFLGGKEIQVLYVGRGHTRGDSIVYVPQDRIVYMSELFFADQFLFVGDGYGLDWLKSVEATMALGADIYVPGHGVLPADPKQSRQTIERFRNTLVTVRDSVQQAIASNATEDQAVATIFWPQYEGQQGYPAQRESVIRRLYRQLTGVLQ